MASYITDMHPEDVQRAIGEGTRVAEGSTILCIDEKSGMKYIEVYFRRVNYFGQVAVEMEIRADGGVDGIEYESSCMSEIGHRIGKPVGILEYVNPQK